MQRQYPEKMVTEEQTNNLLTKHVLKREPKKNPNYFYIWKGLERMKYYENNSFKMYNKINVRKRKSLKIKKSLPKFLNKANTYISNYDYTDYGFNFNVKREIKKETEIESTSFNSLNKNKIKNFREERGLLFII